MKPRSTATAAATATATVTGIASRRIVGGNVRDPFSNSGLAILRSS